MLLVFLLAVLPYVMGTQLVSAYKRVLLHAKDKAYPATNVVDPGQNRMVNHDGGTVYTRADADNLTLRAKDWAISQYGLNYYGAAPGPYNGSFFLPQGIMVPFANGDDYLYRLTFDTDELAVGILDNTYILDVGYLFFMTTSGTFTGGVMNGTTFKAGDILCYTQYNYLKEWGRGRNYPGKGEEIITIQCNQPTVQILNSQGFTEQFIKGDIFYRGKEGRAYIASTTTTENGVPIMRVRSTLTFNHTGV